MSVENNIDLAFTTVQDFNNVTGSDALVESVTMAPGASFGADVVLTAERSTGCLSASVFATGHSEHFSFSRGDHSGGGAGQYRFRTIDTPK